MGYVWVSEVGGGDGGAIYTGMYRREISRAASRRETLPRGVVAGNFPARRPGGKLSRAASRREIENDFGLVIQILTFFMLKILSDSKVCKKY